MVFAAAHILSGLIVTQLVRDYLIKDKRHFPLYLVLVGGIAGLLPDIDIILYFILYAISPIPVLSVHRLLTHSVVWPFLTLIGSYWAYLTKNKKALYWLLAITIGLTLHVVLDIISGYTPALAPFSQQLIGFNLLPDTQIGRHITMGIDAVLLVAWLVYIELKHKISSFI